jgi:hypothetical protein
VTGLTTASSPQFAGINIGHASDTTLTRVSAGVIAVEGSNVIMASNIGVSVQAYDALTQKAGKQTLWIPAAAMTARTTNGAAGGTTETTTNKVMLKTLDFDAATQEYAQFSVQMPKSWNEGTVTFVPVWSHASTTTNFGVVWELQGLALSDDDALDAAFGTAQTSTDTGGTTSDLYRGPESSAITIAGTPATSDVVIFQIGRKVADANDNMAIDARLHGIAMFYTTDAANDA